MKIGRVTFGKDDFGYGMAYILWKNGIESKRAGIKTAREFDVLLFSIFWWAHVYKFYAFCHKAKVGGKRETPHIIVGGFNAFNPNVFFPFAHQVVVGDGEDVIMAALKKEYHSSIYTGREKEVIYADSDIKTNNYVYDHTDISRIEIARGCKYKCPYCQLTHLKPYREVNLESVIDALNNVKTKRVGLFAPNGMTHKDYDKIIDHCISLSLTNIASDVRYNEIDRYRNSNTAKVGIEGVSYRLRKAVSKPITNEKFLKLLINRANTCRKLGYAPSIETYFILDLPTEDESDWKEFQDLLDMVDKTKELNDLTWIMTANVFMPGPHTPFENEVIHLDRDYKSIWREAITDFKRDKPYNFTIGGRHSVFSPYSRLLSMIATRGGKEAGEIIYNITANENLKRALLGKWRKSLRVLSKFLDHYEGMEKYTEAPREKPWKIVKIKNNVSTEKY